LHLESTSPSSAQNSFFLPQWGGVQIFNPPPSTKHLDSTSLRPAFSTFIGHLLSLLGTPALPDSIPAEERVILSPWQLDGLVRQRAAENLVAAGGTMGSLARLVRKIPNMAIPQEIRSDVLLTLSHLDKVRELTSKLMQTCAALHSSAFDVALHHSTLALEYAEKAFFDDKMVSMLYFPDEHKYAIYTPLFGPLALPLLLALLKELQGVIKGWKSTPLKNDTTRKCNSSRRSRRRKDHSRDRLIA
jgi:GPI-anchor transamidase subunit S